MSLSSYNPLHSSCAQETRRLCLGSCGARAGRRKLVGADSVRQCPRTEEAYEQDTSSFSFVQEEG